MHLCLLSGASIPWWRTRVWPMSSVSPSTTRARPETFGRNTLGIGLSPCTRGASTSERNTSRFSRSIRAPTSSSSRAALSDTCSTAGPMLSMSTSIVRFVWSTACTRSVRGTAEAAIPTATTRTTMVARMLFRVGPPTDQAGLSSVTGWRNLRSGVGDTYLRDAHGSLGESGPCPLDTKPTPGRRDAPPRHQTARPTPPKSTQHGQRIRRLTRCQRQTGHAPAREGHTERRHPDFRARFRQHRGTMKTKRR